jgi:hypothetical protein
MRSFSPVLTEKASSCREFLRGKLSLRFLPDLSTKFDSFVIPTYVPVTVGSRAVMVMRMKK